MNKGHLFLAVLFPLFAFTPFETDLEKETLLTIIYILVLVLFILLIFEIQRYATKRKPGKLKRLFRKQKLEVALEKDRHLRPQVLTMTITNTGKHEAVIESPVLEYRKIWSKRKFKLNGINGQLIYPMYIDPGKHHQLRIETSTFHQYDRSVKSFYWARIYVTEVNGKKWKSNNVKLRKSLFT